MTNKILELYKEVTKLKTLIRSGWVQRMLPLERLESVAEHCFSMGFLAMLLAKEEKLSLDMSKVYSMILVHELGEIDAGDITPYDNISKVDKYNLELKGQERISKLFGDNYFISLWKEFEENKTSEAKFVKKIDKLDAVMQSKIYSEQIENGENLFNEFYSNALDKIEHYANIFT